MNKTPKYLRPLEDFISLLMHIDNGRNLNISILGDLNNEIKSADRKHKRKIKTAAGIIGLAGAIMFVANGVNSINSLGKQEDDFYSTSPGMKYKKLQSAILALYTARATLNSSGNTYILSTQELQKMTITPEAKKEINELSDIVRSKTINASSNITKQISEKERELELVKSTYEYITYKNNSDKTTNTFYSMLALSFSLLLAGGLKYFWPSKENSKAAESLLEKANSMYNKSVSKALGVKE